VGLLPTAQKAWRGLNEQLNEDLLSERKVELTRSDNGGEIYLKAAISGRK
jgi:hypothetical protein